MAFSGGIIFDQFSYFTEVYMACQRHTSMNVSSTTVLSNQRSFQEKKYSLQRAEKRRSKTKQSKHEIRSNTFHVVRSSKLHSAKQNQALDTRDK